MSIWFKNPTIDGDNDRAICESRLTIAVVEKSPA